MTEVSRLFRPAVVAALAFSTLLPAQAGLLTDDEARAALAEQNIEINRLRVVTEDQLKQFKQWQEQLAALDKRLNDLTGHLVRQWVDEREVLDQRIGRMAQVGARDLSQITAQLLELRNQLEELTARQQQWQSSRSQPSAADIAAAERFKQLEQQLATLAERVDKGLSAPTPAPAVEPARDQLFELALVELERSDAPSAAALLKVFLRLYPEHSRAQAAQYWLGMSFNLAKDYPSAIEAFDKLPRMGGRDQRLLAEGLYGKASALWAVGDTAAARKVLNQLITTYPAEPTAAQAKTQLERLPEPVKPQPRKVSPSPKKKKK